MNQMYTDDPKNRTEEFFSIASSMKQNYSTNKTKNDNTNKNSKTKKNEFFQITSQIGKQIHLTCLKLSDLSKLAKSTSLYNDPTHQIQILTHEIKEEIQTLNRQLESVEILASHNTGKQNRQTTQHTNQIVGSLKGQLANTTQSFQGVLRERTENLKKQQERRSKFMDNSSFFFSANNNTSSRKISYAMDESKTNSTNLGFDIDIIENTNNNFNSQNSLQTVSYRESRVNVVEDIEKTIHEIGTIFSRLANLIQNQDTQIEWIDQNVDETLENIEQGERELRKYSESIGSNRWLIFKIFAILIVFILIFVLIM
ncbi:syntaxin-5 [Anaeramoeba flamelloides]|uniref:Syntaxin-5 n=1 Tax=Anaeramoeba flamelloides TaxID=1746091 RepID=A0AAV7YE16_9EUKA|nr:syntaxin-5 [Anaeramoeba flamelloides]